MQKMFCVCDTHGLIARYFYPLKYRTPILRAVYHTVCVCLLCVQSIELANAAVSKGVCLLCTRTGTTTVLVFLIQLGAYDTSCPRHSIIKFMQVGSKESVHALYACCCITWLLKAVVHAASRCTCM